ncbi:MAG: hypothetical protein ACYTBV_16795 [Planctomycetota bacterium]|jgi:hypothetical protein
MSNKSLYFIKAVIFALLALAIVFWDTQAFGEHWQKTFDEGGSEGGFSVQQTTDGGFIIAGSYASTYPGHGYPYLIKTDANGNKLWSKTFRGAGPGHANSVQQTTDGGYIIGGGAGNDVYLLKTDDSGNLIWEKTFARGSRDCGYSVQQTTDGGFIIVGFTGSSGEWDDDVYLIKTDANGNELWSKTFGGIGDERGMSVQQTTDGGYIITGYSRDYWYCPILIKTDANGNALWGKTYEDSGCTEVRSVQQTTDGGYIMAGGLGDFCLIKTDANGNMLWSKTFGGSGGEEGWSVQQTTDGGYIIAGRSDIGDPIISFVYLVKTDANGNELWSKRFGGLFFDAGRSVQQTTDGGYIIAGETNSFGGNYYDVYLIYYKPEWEIVYNTLFDNPSDLRLLRQYRDKILSNTTRGQIYQNLLYKLSKQALEVLLSNPDKIVAFLDAYAKKSPPILKILAYIVRWDMLRTQRRDDLFFGFRLK